MPFLAGLGKLEKSGTGTLYGDSQGLLILLPVSTETNVENVPGEMLIARGIE